MGKHIGTLIDILFFIIIIIQIVGCSMTPYEQTTLLKGLDQSWNGYKPRNDLSNKSNRELELMILQKQAQQYRNSSYDSYNSIERKANGIPRARYCEKRPIYTPEGVYLGQREYCTVE